MRWFGNLNQVHFNLNNCCFTMRLLLHSLLSGIAREVFYFCFSSFCVVHSPKPGKKAVHSIKILQNDMQIAKTLILVRAQQWRRLFGGKQAFLLPTNSIKRKVEKKFKLLCCLLSSFDFSCLFKPTAWPGDQGKKNRAKKVSSTTNCFAFRCCTWLRRLVVPMRIETSRDLNADHNWRQWVTEWASSPPSALMGCKSVNWINVNNAVWSKQPKKVS